MRFGATQTVKEWLNRSGSCPLLFSIAYPFDYSPQIGDDGEEEEVDVACPLFQIKYPPVCATVGTPPSVDATQHKDTP